MTPEELRAIKERDEETQDYFDWGCPIQAESDRRALLAEVEALRKRVALLESAGNALLDGMDGAHRNLANALAAREKTT